MRIGLGDRRAVGLVNWTVAQVSGLVAGTTPPNLFLILGRHRRLFRGWLRFAGQLMPGGVLPRSETELVILRVAALRGCDYELAHHRRLAEQAGLTGDEIASVTSLAAAEPPGGWGGRRRVVLAAVDELHRTRDLSDRSWSELRSRVDEREAIELVMLVGHYDMLATAISALRVPPDMRRRAPMRLPFGNRTVAS